MAVVCPSYYQGQVARFTRLDSCGKPVYNGNCNQVVTDGFITITISPEVDEGDEITQKKANGKLCLSISPCPQIKYYNLEMQFCEVDPSLVQLINPTWEPVCDSQTRDVVGFDAVGDLDCSTGYALELWMGTATQVDACSGEGSSGQFGYLLIPWVTGGAIGDIEVGGEAITFTFKGRSKRGSGWGRGPHRVQLDELGSPARLNKPIGRKTDFRQFVTNVAPPDPACGCFALEQLPADPPELVVTRVDANTVSVTVNNHGSGAVDIAWDATNKDVGVREGRAVRHTYSTSGPQTITVTQTGKTATDPGSITRTFTTPMPITPVNPDDPTPPSDTPSVSGVATYTDPNDPSNPNCITAVIEMGKWAIRSPAEAEEINPCQGGADAQRPDVWVDWGDGSKPDGVRLDPATGKTTVHHCYPRAGFYNITTTRDDGTTFKGGINNQQVPPPAPPAPLAPLAAKK